MGNCYYCNMGKTVFFRSLEESDADLIYEWMNDDSLKNEVSFITNDKCFIIDYDVCCNIICLGIE